MAVDLLNLQRTYSFERDRLVRHAGWTLEAHRRGKDSLSLVLVGDKRMRLLNRTYRGKSATTDVLSFEGPPAPPGKGERFLGEIVISLPRAFRQAREAGIPPDDEITNLAIHGICHLLGYDHEKGDKELRLMKKAEEKAAREIREREGRPEALRHVTGKIPGEGAKDTMPEENRAQKRRKTV